MNPSKKLQEAEARLNQLLEQGLIEGVGTVQKDHGTEFLIGVRAQTDPRAGDYDAGKISVLRSQLRDALQDVPFSILGDYTDESHLSERSDRLVEVPRTALATSSGSTLSGPVTTSIDPPHDFTAERSRLSESNLGGISNELAASEHKVDASILRIQADVRTLVTKIDAVNEQLARLNKTLEGLPSTGLIITVAAVLVALIAPSILFQGRGSNLLHGLQRLFGM